MGVYQYSDFSGGWMPSADAFNCPKNSLLRMDNLMLDELGVVALRQGSAKINTAAFTDTDVHSLFTTTLNSTRYRMSGANNAVYANGTSISSGITGSGDISFGAHMGNILFARGTTKKKYDGTTVRNLGIAAPNAAPTIAALATSTATLSTCTSVEAPGMVSNEGTQTFVNDRAGTANAAVQLAPDTTTGRAVSTKTFAAPTDFSGTDDDLLDLYVRVAEPQYVISVTVMVDFNGATFQEDYVEHTFVMGDETEIVQGAEDALSSNYTIEGEDRDRVIGDMEDRTPARNAFRPDIPSGNTGWNHFSVPRGTMLRSGLTAGKNWSTVEAVRLVVNAIAGGAGAAVRFDEITIIGSATRTLTGKFKAAVVAVRNDGTYQAKSAPSTFSTEIEVKAQGIRATVASGVISALDTQANELWLFLMGGRMKSFYRFAVLTGGPWTGAQTIDATISEISALATNIRMETDSAVPPDTIIGIEGPHFDRTLYLTATGIYPSRQLNPDSCSAGEVVTIGDAAETGLWIKKLGESTVFVGTTRDIYRFDGDWTPQPDGSINVIKRPLHVAEPPVSSAVEVGTVNGAETLIYLSGDGWHALGFGPLVNNAVDLLWRGFTRHGVSFVNIAGSTARFRCAVAKNVLFALTPEGSSTTSTATIHAYHFGKQRWYRFTYPQAFRSLYAEADGTLIAGDASGFVRTLDLATKQDDGVDIPVVMWTPIDDDGQPFTYKDAENLWLRLDTGNNTATVAFHLNGSGGANSSTTTAQVQTQTLTADVSSLAEFTQMQLRITGSFSTFVFRGYMLRYLDNPAPQVIHDTGYIDLSADVLKWVAKIRVKAKSPVDFTVQPYWDGEAATTRTVSVGAFAGIATTFDVPMGREDRAKVGRVVITSASPSHVFWVELFFNGTGKPLQKRISLVPEAA